MRLRSECTNFPSQLLPLLLFLFLFLFLRLPVLFQPITNVISTEGEDFTRNPFRMNILQTLAPRKPLNPEIYAQGVGGRGTPS